jgi:hypothetical protein
VSKREVEFEATLNFEGKLEKKLTQFSVKPQQLEILFFIISFSFFLGKENYYEINHILSYIISFFIISMIVYLILKSKIKKYIISFTRIFSIK